MRLACFLVLVCAPTLCAQVTVPTQQQHEALAAKQAADDAARRAELQLINQTLVDLSARLSKLETPLPPPPPPPDDDPPPPPPPTSGLIKPADITWLGTFRLPQSIGSNQSANWTWGGCAFRRVDGEKRLFAIGHVHQGSQIYEVAIPETTVKGVSGSPVAQLRKNWGSAVYGGKRSGVPGEVWTHGLRFEGDTLWWHYGSNYAVQSETQSSFGRTRFNADGTLTALGPYKTTVHSNRTRGGSMLLPQWFADKYTDGKRFVVGVGGVTSGVATCSGGPHMSVLQSGPSDAAETMQVKTILDYPWRSYENQGAYNRPEFLCRRSADYSGDPHMAYPGGYWTQGDYVGEGAYVAANGKHAFVFFGSLVSGSITYNAGAQISARKNVLLIYDPDEIGKAALGEIPVHAPRPVQVDLPSPDLNLIQWGGGMSFDPVENRLYLFDARGWDTGSDLAPLCHVYEVK